MTALIAWGEATLLASALLMLLVLVIRAPVRRSLGPRLAYMLWALPAMRMVLPPLPAGALGTLPVPLDVAAGMSVLFAGPRSASGAWVEPHPSLIGLALLTIWLAGAVALFAVYALRHLVFCRRLQTEGTELGRVGGIRVVAADVEGPLAFGVFRRFIVVPRAFARDYRVRERDLALAHERAHHARGDLLASWLSLIVLAAHWWNPLAWLAIGAFRDDQEYAADAYVLADKEPGTRALYAHVLAKAAGVGALPACNLNAHSNLKGRLMMIGQKQRSSRRIALGGAMLALCGTAALAATAATLGTSGAGAGTQAVTIGVKPDGSGGYALILGDAAVAPGAPLPGGLTLPADFSEAGGCDLKPSAKPFAMVIKGAGATQTYTVMCAGAAPASVRATLAEGIVSLNAMRASVTTQRATPVFPEAERTHALRAIDRSIREIQATSAAIN